LHHPVASFFHLLWKLSALIAYLFGGYMFANHFVIAFVTCVVLIAFDFWTTKNVSGRLMVGLRWWNEIKEDGSNEWVFESLEDKSKISSFEKVLFWGGLFGSPILWVTFAIVSFFGLNPRWLLITLIGAALGIANIVGYVKCARDARNKLKSMATSYIASTVINQSLQRV